MLDDADSGTRIKFRNIACFSVGPYVNTFTKVAKELNRKRPKWNLRGHKKIS